MIVTIGTQIGLFSSVGDRLHIFKGREKVSLLLSVEWHPLENLFSVDDSGDNYAVGVENVLLQIWSLGVTKLRNKISGGNREYPSIRRNSVGIKYATASEALGVWTKDGDIILQSRASNDLIGVFESKW